MSVPSRPWSIWAGCWVKLMLYVGTHSLLPVLFLASLSSSFLLPFLFSFLAFVVITSLAANLALFSCSRRALSCSSILMPSPSHPWFAYFGGMSSFHAGCLCVCRFLSHFWHQGRDFRVRKTVQLYSSLLYCEKGSKMAKIQFWLTKVLKAKNSRQKALSLCCSWC